MKKLVRVSVKLELGTEDAPLQAYLESKWADHLDPLLGSYKFYFTVTKLRGQFVISVRLISPKGVFGHEAISSSFLKAISKVENRILMRLDNSAFQQKHYPSKRKRKNQELSTQLQQAA